MASIQHYWLFLLAGILLNLTPGQDTLFVIGRSLSGGLQAGIAAGCGIAIGTLAHTLAAALGLSLLLATSALAFGAVKLLGAAYLLYLGARLLLAPAGTAAAAATGAAERSATPRAAFVQGIVTNVLNPKVALFFLAFLPQFVLAGSSSRVAAFLLLGLTFITTGLAWCVVLALAAARLQSFFAANPSVRALLDRAVGALFVGLGLRLAWAR
jgi:threonine/homoserine/homoserine lactone efflux protein